jgi:bifunctional non-homologous end joining protein LigD
MKSAAKSAGPSTMTFGNKRINVSNLDKVLYPSAGFTKQDVIDYYVGISDVILKHLKGRTVTLKRYPNGSEQSFFYEKNCPIHRPPWISTTNVASQRTGGTNYCMVDSKAALAWMGQIASLELHTSLAKGPNITKPTMAVFDLDPGPPADILDCIRVAIRMRDVLKGLGLESFPKTSGSKGLHFYVPLNTPCTFDDTKRFARAVADLFEKEDPEHVTADMKKSLRVNKVLVDWSQNDEHKTTVCPYSLRARTRPTVSTPVTWKELEAALKAKDSTKLVFEARDVLARVKKQGDLFEPVLTLKQKLPKF